ncbi:hypothetical protein [Leyella stercorea]|uniref:hypothetical protein n=1 Tax=Leyella stercorea TaxID=363265 RepID=UPI00243287D6|nr:hypothetical protein [Leyella stercorea]
MNPDNVFDLCPQTTSDITWSSPAPVVHVYCDGTKLELDALGFATVTTNPVATITLGSSYDKTNITIEIDNENGLTIDGNTTALSSTVLATLFNNSSLTFASQEGSGRMHGTYKSVKVVSKTAPSGIVTSTNETTPEHVFTMRNANGDYVNSNLYRTLATSDYAQFAFYEVSGKTNAYYIYNYSAKKWLKYTTSATYTKGKDFVSNGEKSERCEFYITDAAKDGVSGVQIQPYNAAGNAANNYLNFYGGGGANVSNTIGNYTTDGNNDAGSLWVFTEVEIANNNAVITSTTIPTGTSTNLKTNWKATKNTAWEVTTPIDWNTQQLIVTVDLNGVYAADAQGNRVVLCVTGADDELGWTENTGRSIFYNYSSTQVQGYVLEGDNANTGRLTYTNPLVFRYTKDGMYLGDEATPTHNSTRLAKLLSQKNIKIGANNEACSGTYTIQLASNDYAPAQTYSDNILRETATVSFNAQDNVDVQLERTLSPEYWNTFCVPFSISAEVIKEMFGEGTQVCTFGSMEGTVMNFAHSTSIEAGKPYIVKPTKEVVNPSFTGVNIEATAAKQVGANGYFMQGIYSVKTDLTTDGTNLFLGDGNKFYKPLGTTTAKMKGMRAFFIVPQGTNFAALRANIDGATTAIDELTTVVEQPTDNRIYNLQGQFVGTNFEGLHGVYVQNGKKVLVK